MPAAALKDGTRYRGLVLVVIPRTELGRLFRPTPIAIQLIASMLSTLVEIRVWASSCLRAAPTVSSSATCPETTGAAYEVPEPMPYWPSRHGPMIATPGAATSALRPQLVK